MCKCAGCTRPTPQNEGWCDSEIAQHVEDLLSEDQQAEEIKLLKHQVEILVAERAQLIKKIEGYRGCLSSGGPIPVELLIGEARPLVNRTNVFSTLLPKE